MKTLPAAASRIRGIFRLGAASGTSVWDQRLEPASGTRRTAAPMRRDRGRRTGSQPSHQRLDQLISINSPSEQDVCHRETTCARFCRSEDRKSSLLQICAKTTKNQSERHNKEGIFRPESSIFTPGQTQKDNSAAS